MGRLSSPYEINRKGSLSLVSDIAHGHADRFAELRIQDDAITSITLVDGEIEELAESESNGMFARVYANGVWGLASATGTKLQIARDVINKAAAGLSRSSANRGRENILNLPVPVTTVVEGQHERSLSEMPLEEKVAFLKTATDQASNRFLTGTRLVYTERTGSVSIFNSQGMNIRTPSTNLSLIVSMTSRRQGKSEEVAAVIGGRGGFDIVDNEETRERIAELAEKAERLALARGQLRGKFRAVLDPEVGGVLVHEAIGHACESDLPSYEQRLSKRPVGKAHASKLVTVVDDPTLRSLAGSIDYDDEGTVATRKTLVEKGKLSTFMTDVDAATRHQLPLTGNARTEDYRFGPIVRMTNTFLEPGDWSHEEMIESVSSGVYLAGPAFGRIDYNKGIFELKCSEASLIRGGRLTRMFSHITAIARIDDALKGIVALGKDLKFNQQHCRKFAQVVDLAVGSPDILIRKIVVSA